MIEIDFVKVGEYLERNKLWAKRFAMFNKGEMQNLCEAILDATTVREGFVMPYIDERGCLIIPIRAPLKYRPWMGGQSALETLEELGASDEIKARYTPTGYGEGAPKP